ncbi:MAG TPA: glutaredoxin family protein [Solirubrobacterales bacterium]|nr:glutaredoxin family protein [Solirubrobacterales bacterium]
MPSPRVTLYARPDCHLCDEARAGLERLRADGLDFEIDEVDIETEDELHARFLERIPVVEVEGEIVSELWLDVDGLRTRLDTLSA